MIGIVVVSHSRALAEAAVALAARWCTARGRGSRWPPARRGDFGTDAIDDRRGDRAGRRAGRRTRAHGPRLRRAQRGDGARARRAAVASRVRSRGAAGRGPGRRGRQGRRGADLETVAREAEAALLPKVVSLAEHTPLPALVAVEADVSARLMLVNPQGLHARPAAQIATAVGGLSAEVAVESGGRRADASSSLELITLGAGPRCGDHRVGGGGRRGAGRGRRPGDGRGGVRRAGGQLTVRCRS